MPNVSPALRPPRTLRCALVALAVLAPAVAVAQPAAPALQIPTIPVERYRLPNGLTVLLSVDRSAPVVAVDMWYHVGSKNEKPGRTGFAHLFEHVMFQGSRHVAEEQHFKIVEAAGGDVNGTTSNDRTNYYETLPSNELETALWLESDRMGFLLPVLTQAKLDGQRDVVKNERRQRVDNQPFGSRFEVVSAAIYPAGHPYSWPVIGSMADLSAATLDDVKDFFRRYYTPNNATLAIVGDIDVAKTRKLIERYFGGIPAGPAVERPLVEPVTLAAEKRLVLEDAKARLPQLTLVWPTVGIAHPDVHALRALSLVLAQDRTSRLTKALVYERQLATSVNAHPGSDEKVGELWINITPRPNASLTAIEAVVDSVIATIREAAPTEREVARARNYFVVGAITRQQSVHAKAEELAEGQVFFGDPLRYRTDIQAFAAVTPADVQRVARAYLTPGRVVLSMVPAGKLDLVSRPDLPFANATPAPAAAIAMPASSAR